MLKELSRDEVLELMTLTTSALIIAYHSTLSQPQNWAVKNLIKEFEELTGREVL